MQPVELKDIIKFDMLYNTISFEATEQDANGFAELASPYGAYRLSRVYK